VPLDALANPLVLPLLGLLVEEPAHAYELTHRLTDRYPHLQVRRSSVTTLVGSLAAAGLVKPQRRRRVARRPARTTYALTEPGYDHVRARVAADIVSAGARSTRFMLAIAYVGILPRSAAADVLRQRLVARRAEEQSLAAGHTLPEYQMLEVDYWHALIRTEIAWIETLVHRLETGAIEWPRHAPARKET
jgi:DNA-binding PadR family transcriptional regulator